jgi:hypothetical protein
MIGKDIFEDLSIDSIEIEQELKERARVLVDHWGPEITENDLLRLNAMINSNESTVEHTMAKYILEYYLTKDFVPEFIHADMLERD